MIHGEKRSYVYNARYRLDQREYILYGPLMDGGVTTVTWGIWRVLAGGAGERVKKRLIERLLGEINESE